MANRTLFPLFGDAIPGHAPAPYKNALGGDEDIDAFAEGVWNALDDDNKVSLFVRYIDVATGKAESRIINKNQ